MTHGAKPGSTWSYLRYKYPVLRRDILNNTTWPLYVVVLKDVVIIIPIYYLGGAKWSDTNLFRFRTPYGSTITFFYLKVETFHLRKFKLLLGECPLFRKCITYEFCPTTFLNTFDISRQFWKTIEKSLVLPFFFRRKISFFRVFVGKNTMYK